ncbi:MAG: 4Fe-4S binding protein [Phycisphaerales bacterium]|nr:4Fe-4S binding protein [Phycisphaerales bacterium]
MHLLMVGHVLHWWITGESVGRFVLSDSMKLLELGEINPGAILFALALLTTAIMGRFMCGWVCHVGALQDLAAWILRRLGVRPHMFRSRLLGYAPLALASYMFLWPTFGRVVLGPALRPVWPEGAAAVAGPPFPGFSLALSTTSLWDGLPSLAVAIPFLVVCGGLVVLFLGARGLCRYACPYGGFLLPAEHLAVARVTVDPAKCDQCGLCTAACTAGVRVHDEVRLYGAVLDKNCIKSLDCVGACPHGALSMSLGRPPLARGGPTRYDLTWPEEFMCLAIGVGAFLTLRGLYDRVPLLMAAPVGIIAAYVGWKALRVLRDRDVIFARAQLRRGGKLTAAGAAFLLFTVLAAGMLVHSAAVRLLVVRAGRHDANVTVTFQGALGQVDVPQRDRASAEAGARLYRLAGPWWRGGIGLDFTPEASTRAAWLRLVGGDARGAIDELDALHRAGRTSDQNAADLAFLLARGGDRVAAEQVLRDTLAARPAFSHSREQLAGLMIEDGRAAEAVGMFEARVAERPSDALARVGLARALAVTGSRERAVAELAEAAGRAPREPAVARDYALALHAAGRLDDAVAELRRGAEARPAAKQMLLTLAREMLRRAGRESELDEPSLPGS